MKSFKTFLESEERKPVYMRDNPGGDWLKYKQEDAEKYHARTNYVGGATTGNWRNLKIPVTDLINLPGAMGEEAYRRHSAKFEKLHQNVLEHGWDEDPIHSIYVAVNHKGEAYIGEGNHRVAVAHRVGRPWIWGEVRYFNGGEKVPGPWHPDEVRKRYVSE